MGLRVMRAILFVLANVKNVAVLLSGVVLIVFFAVSIISRRESAPTTVHLDHWETEYHGQEWVILTGIARPDLGVVTPRKAFFPVVSSDFKAGDPIHAVVFTEPTDMPHQSGVFSTQGLMSTGTWDSKKIMPSGTYAKDMRWLQMGEKPLSKGLYFIVLLGLLFVVVGSRRLYRSTPTFFPSSKPLDMQSVARDSIY